MKFVLVFALFFNSLTAFGNAPQCAVAVTAKQENSSEKNPSIEELRLEIENQYQKHSENPRWFQSQLLYGSHLKVIKSFAERVQQIEQIPAADVQNPEFNNLLKRLVLHPQTKLSVEDLRLLEKNKFHKEIARGTLQILSAATTSPKALHQMMSYWYGGSPYFTFLHEKTWSKRALRVLQGTYNGPVRFLIPVIPLKKWRDPVNEIFDKKFNNPAHELSEKELQTLQQYGAVESYQQNVDLQKRIPTWVGFRKWLARAFVATIAINGAIVANWGLHLAKPEALVSADTFLSQSQYRLKDNQVRIYNESVPFPHMAIEMDGKVYSYGQTHMSIKTSQEYLLIDKITRLAQEQQGPLNAKITKEEKSFDLYSIIHSTGLDQLPRSVQMVTLNLEPADKDRLKRHLELSNYSAYHNQTLAMDCATMIALALKNNTQVPVPSFGALPLTFDASPGGMMMYFGALKSLGLKNSQGVDLVGGIQQVAVDQPQRHDLHLWRNLYINAIESRVVLSFLSINAATRSYLNLRYGESGFQYLEPEVRQEILGWQKNVISEILNPQTDNPIGNQISIFVQEADKLAQTPPDQRGPEWLSKAEQLKRISDYYLKREIQSTKEQMDSPDSAFSDIIRSGFRYELLHHIQNRLNQRLNTTNPTSGPIVPDDTTLTLPFNF